MEPVVLRNQRRTPIAVMSFIAVAGVMLFAIGLTTEGETAWKAFVLSGTCLIGIIWLLVEWAYAGSAGLEVRLDTAGVTIGRHRIPWDAVQSAKWSSDAVGGRSTVRKPGILLHVRDVEAYKAPRAGTEVIDHRALRIPANVLLDAIVRFAHPHTVFVLAVDPGEAWATD